MTASQPGGQPAPDTALAEAMAARLCHDLAGPIGTVGNMLEIAHGSDQAAEALTHAHDAAEGLRRRLRLLRAAWGGVADWPAGGLPPLAASIATPRLLVVLDAAAVAGGRTPRAGRLLLNVALLGAELARGRGEIALRAGPLGIAAVLAAPSLPSWPVFAAAVTADPRAFQRTWTALLAAACGAELRPAGATLHIRLPV